ncbi:hypothetical protein [Mesorhizobium sp. L-8-3]|uniref:hypothetical protein n=1 Tax=Mesorhizobium sp. L-8-3 TaxID=2744522 RepID=UPI001925DCF6|nr:hypothetical protein [Mesorhizobium sp. L-8-3]BCH23808.1 hypothetical protein MesoLjLb_35930 [Mesorhizobium sp. L-8-3]
MRSALFCALMFAADMLAAGPAAAWLLYPDRDNPRHMVVEIEKATGDLVAFRSLPPPYNNVVQSVQGPERFTFRWRYGKDGEGSAFMRVDEDGQGTIQFDFTAREKLGDRRFGAAAVLVADDGTPLHTFYARADLADGSFGRGELHHRVSLDVERAPAWWRKVGAISFFSMTYYPLQKLDDEGVWRAMRQAVGNFSKGQGTEQRG